MPSRQPRPGSGCFQRTVPVTTLVAPAARAARQTPCEAVGSRVRLRAATPGRAWPLPHRSPFGVAGDSLRHSVESGPASRRDPGKGTALTQTAHHTVVARDSLRSSGESGPASRRDPGKGTALTQTAHHLVLREAPCEAVGSRVRLSAVTLAAQHPHPARSPFGVAEDPR